MGSDDGEKKRQGFDRGNKYARSMRMVSVAGAFGGVFGDCFRALVTERMSVGALSLLLNIFLIANRRESPRDVPASELRASLIDPRGSQARPIAALS
jgi:hypothetical protein